MSIFFDELGMMELRCGFGGGSGGGGGGAGAVDYPTYMKDWHEDALGTWSASSISDVIAAKYGNDPFQYLTPFDPGTAIIEMETTAASLRTLAATVGGSDSWTLIPNVWYTMFLQAVNSVDMSMFSDVNVNAEIAAYNAIVDADIVNIVLPRFRRGMQDINAVNSSAFVIGEAFIEAENTRQKDKFAADLRLQNYRERTATIVSSVTEMVRLLSAKVDMQKAIATTTLEKCRLEIISRKEQTDIEIHLDELSYKADLELFGYAGNMLAAIGSASVRTGQQYNPTASAIGGIMGGVGALMMGAAMIPW